MTYLVKCHCLRKCSRGQICCGQLIWLRLDTEFGCDEIFQQPLWLTSLTLSFGVSGGGGVSFFALHHQKSSLSGGILKVQHRLATEIRRKITDLTMFFKIKTGNVRISFPNDLREVHCPYLTRGSAQHPFHLQRYSSTINVFRKNCSRLERFVSCFRTC